MKMSENDFKRDERSRALINKNKEAYEQYKRVKRKDAEINELKREVSDIKSMLLELLNKD